MNSLHSILQLIPVGEFAQNVDFRRGAAMPGGAGMAEKVRGTEGAEKCAASGRYGV